MKPRYLLLLVGCFPLLSFAAMPVIDVSNLVQTTATVNQLKTQYETLLNQYQQLKDQYQSITGQYGWGKLKNTLQDLKAVRQWGADNWQAALDGMAGGNAERFAELIKQYQKAHIHLSADSYAKGRDTALAQEYDQAIKVNQAAHTQATYELDQINQHLQSLYELGQAVESNSNSGLKSAVDLNSRIAMQLGYLQVEQIRMQALMNQQLNQAQSSQISELTEAAEFNQAGVES